MRQLVTLVLCSGWLFAMYRSWTLPMQTIVSAHCSNSSDIPWERCVVPSYPSSSRASNILRGILRCNGATLPVPHD